jgi:hypothetical protein
VKTFASISLFLSLPPLPPPPSASLSLSLPLSHGQQGSSAEWWGIAPGSTPTSKTFALSLHSHGGVEGEEEEEEEEGGGGGGDGGVAALLLCGGEGEGGAEEERLFVGTSKGCVECLHLLS